MPVSVLTTECFRFLGKFLMTSARHLLGYRTGQINIVHVGATCIMSFDIVRSQEIPASLVPGTPGA